MGDFTQKDMTGQLFKNTKATKDTHPGYTGSMTVNGVKYSIAAWLNEGAKGKYFSISVKPYDDTYHKSPPKERAQTGGLSGQEKPFEDDNLSDIPFITNAGIR